MHKGHVDIGHITEEMLYRLKFTEHTHTVYSGGFWKSKGVAVPDYPYEAPWVWQVFEDECPPWVKHTKTLFPWLKNSVVTVNKLMPGRFIAPHQDTLYKLRKKVEDEGSNIEGMEPYRVNLFLQDRLMGHYFEMEDQAWIDCSDEKDLYRYVYDGWKVDKVLKNGDITYTAVSYTHLTLPTKA